MNQKTRISKLATRPQFVPSRTSERGILVLLFAVLAASSFALAEPAAAQPTPQGDDVQEQSDRAPEPSAQTDEVQRPAATAEQATAEEQASPTAQNTGPVLKPRVIAEPAEQTQVGRTSEFTVEFDLPEGFQWLSIRPVGNRFVEFVDNSDLTTNGETAQVKVTVVVYRSGEYEIDGFELTYVTPDGTQRQESTDAVSIDVGSVIANEQDPALAPPGPFRMVRTHNPVPLYVLGGVLIALIGFILFRVFRKTEEEEIEVVPLRPAHELALEALDRLETRDLLAQEQHLEFHMVLSAILREFVGRRYGFHAPEMTTTEIRSALTNRQRDVGSYADEILSVLAETDVVKFAKGAPPVDESERLFARTRELVEEIAARELQEPDEVPAPLSGKLPDGDEDEEPSYDPRDDYELDDAVSENSGEVRKSAQTVSTNIEDRALPDDRRTSNDPREPRETLPFGPPNPPKSRPKRVAPENVIAFGERAGSAKKQASTDESLDALRERLRAARKEDRDD